MPRKKSRSFPKYSTHAAEEEEKIYTTKDAKEKIKEFISAYGKTIAIGIAVLLLAFFGINYILNMKAKLTISVVNLEGEAIQSSTIKIFDSSGKQIMLDNGLANYMFELVKGRYEVKVYADGYKVASQIVNLNDDKMIKIVLEKNLNLAIEKMELPERLYLGQQFDLNLEIRSDETITSSGILLFGGILEKFNCDKSILLIQPSIAKKYTLKCTVPESLELKDYCEEKEAKIRLKYLKTSASRKVIICKVPEVTLENISFSVDPVKNAKSRKDIRIKNLSRFPAENIKLRIEISPTTKNNLSEVKNWIKFTNADSENPREIKIDSIDSRGTVKVPIEILIPIYAKAEKIYGSIVMEAPFLKQPKRADLTITITREARVLLSSSIRPQKVAIYTYDGKKKEVTITVSIMNRGDLDVKNIDLKVKNSKECNASWLRFLTTPAISELAPGESKSIALIASSPETAQKGDVMRCILEISYTNPLPPHEIKSEEIGFIEITQR